MSIRIGIVGAGIGGLAAGAFLAQEGHNVTVFDQFKMPQPVGSGLVIQPVGLAVLDRIGAGNQARNSGNRIRRMLGHESDTKAPVLDVWYDRDGTGESFGLGIHRSALFEAVSEAAVAAGAHLIAAHKAAGLARRHITFENQERRGPFDLIVDASGAGGGLSPMKARALPYGAIWGTVPWPATELPQDRLTQSYRRADRMIGVLPCGTLPGSDVPQAAIFWSMPRGGHRDWRRNPLEDWKAEATALWPDFAPFLETITQHDQMTMARYSHGTLRKPFGDHLAIIGDSAHKASPQLGQGANMALLDAMALSEALRFEPDIPTALLHYARARRWHVWIYQAMSWAFTPQYQSDSKWLPVLRDRVLFPVSQIQPLPRVLTRLVCGNMIPPLGSLTPR
ncbi:MAG: NAD(P)/FAD-dependent oxidoreductase [Pseudomonadota bacterium]